MLRYSLAILTVLAIVAAHENVYATPTTYVVGIPPKTTRESAQKILHAAATLLKSAEVGDRIELKDAFDLTPVLAVEIPPGNSNRRKLLLGKTFSTMKRFIVSSISDGDPLANVVRFPQFLDLAARSVHPSSKTRILVFGDACYKDPRDAPFVFGGDLYPSDGHILTTEDRSLFATAHRKEQLRDAAVYYCYLEEHWNSALAKTAITRFQGLFVQEQGGVLAAWSSSGEAVVSAALNNNIRPVLSGASIHSSDTDIVMRRVALPPPPDPRSVRIMIVVDGSISNAKALAASRDLVLSLTRAHHPVATTLGVVVFREKRSSHELALTDSVELVNQFASGKEIEVVGATFQPGSEEGIVSGDPFKTSKMTALGSTVDISIGIKRGLSLLGSPSESTTPILVLIGDVATQEVGENLKNGDRTKADECLWLVRDFVRAHPKTHVITVFTNKSNSERCSESARFFRDVASAAGPRGVFKEEVQEIASVLTRIIESRPSR